MNRYFAPGPRRWGPGAHGGQFRRMGNLWRLGRHMYQHRDEYGTAATGAMMGYKAWADKPWRKGWEYPTKYRASGMAATKLRGKMPSEYNWGGNPPKGWSREPGSRWMPADGRPYNYKTGRYGRMPARRNWRPYGTYKKKKRRRRRRRRRY